MKTVVIICETDGCTNKGMAVNEIELLDCDLDSFMESYGVSGIEMADCCSKCGKLGVAHDEPPRCACFRDNTTYPCKTCKQILCQDCEDTHICDPE